MRKDYYKILEIDKDASEEIIEKAYRILAKKYHPDLQIGPNQKVYEEKLKEINEAYDVLSNTYRKYVYDQELRETTVSQEQLKSVMDENIALKRQLQQTNNYNENKVNKSREIKFNHPPQYYLKLAGIILIVILVLVLLYQIPFIKNICQAIYNGNVIIKLLVDSLVKTFQIGF